MSKLPAPGPDQAFCIVSALESGFINLPLDYLIDTAQASERAKIPCLTFLLRHSKARSTFLFDLGTRKDISSLTPRYIQRIEEMTFMDEPDRDSGKPSVTCVPVANSYTIMKWCQP